MKRFIKAVVSVDERTNTHYSKSFEVIESLPAVGDESYGYIVKEVKKVSIDWENRGEEYAEHDFYKVTSCDEMDPDNSDNDIVEFYAVKKEL